MTTRMTLTGLAAAAALGLSASPAAAQPAEEGPTTSASVPDCPPGAFCEETTVAPPDDVPAPAETPMADEGDSTTVVLPPPPEGSDPAAPRTFTYHPDPNGGPGQIIIYERGAGPPQVVGALEPPPPPPPPREKKRWRQHRRWGLNLRAAGVLMPRYDDDASGAMGMGGLGISLLYRPTPMFALDLGTDFLGGTDANGLQRQELPISISARLYANPRNLVQFYLFGGLNWSFARVFSDYYQSNLRDGTSDDYTYFGGHGGVGLEFRVSRLIGINVDGLAFVRTRTDADQHGLYPEFYDAATGETSNSSAGGLLRAGLTFWW